MTVNSNCFPEQLYPACHCVFRDVGLKFRSLSLDGFHSFTFKKGESADRQLQPVHCHKEGADRHLQSVHCHKDGSAIFAVLRVVLPNSRVLWDVTPCRWLS
jgi:hypothetical protein